MKTASLVGIIVILIIAGLGFWRYSYAPTHIHEQAVSMPVATSTPAVATSTAKVTGIASKPKILVLLPARGKSGITVTIKGIGFDATQNFITFGTSHGGYHPDGSPDTTVARAGSKDGMTLTFVVPNSGPSGIICTSAGHCIAISSILLSPGPYSVAVVNKQGTSNTASFTLTR